MPERHVLITGASSGIGNALARQYARRGVRLSLVARRRALLEALKKEIETSSPSQVEILEADVSNPSQMAAALSQARKRFGPVDTVVANAGFGVLGTFENLSIEDYRKQFDVNVWGVLHTLKPVLEDIKASRGRIAITGSTNAYLSGPTATAYAMSKFAIRALAEGLYVEMGPYGVSVTLLSPGFIATEIRGERDPVPAWLQMSATRAAKQMVSAIERRSRERIVTLHSRVAIWATQFMPGLLLGLARLVQNRTASSLNAAASAVGSKPDAKPNALRE